MSTITKTCPSCEEVKEIHFFGKDSSRSDGLRYHCKVCNNSKSSMWQKENRARKNEYQRNWNKENPEKLRKSHVKQLYGLSWDSYTDLYTKQEGSCKICGTSLPLYNEFFSTDNARAIVVDHCHISGAVRGLLCNQCNKGLGHFSDNVERLKRAVLYLEEFTIGRNN